MITTEIHARAKSLYQEWTKYPKMYPHFWGKKYIDALVYAIKNRNEVYENDAYEVETSTKGRYFWGY